MMILRIIGIILLTGFSALGQQQITVEDIYQGVFREKSVEAIRWMNDGKYYTALEDNKIIKYEITSAAQVEVILDGNASNPTLTIDDYDFSENESKLLIMTEREGIYRRSFRAEYYIFDRSNGSLKKLSSGGKQSYGTFSPDGSKVAFTRENNLFFVSLQDMNEIAVTKDGWKNELINGSTDWVYEEEFSITKAFDWSIDGNKLAYISFDESEVKEYNLQYWDVSEMYPYDYRFKYPKAGEKNSEVSLNIYDLNSQKKTVVALGEEKDYYIPRLQWTKNPSVLSFIRMNRLQNTLEIFHANAENGKAELIFKDESDTYIDIDNVDDLTYLENGEQFIISSEKSGYKHLYLYSIDGELIRQITIGNHPITDFVGVKEDKKPERSKVYYVSAEPSALDRTVYQIDISGENKKLLSPPTGTSSVDMSNDYRFFVLKHDNARKPLEVTLHKLNSKGSSTIQTLEDNIELNQTAKQYGLRPKEFYTYQAADGQLLSAYMLKPENIEEDKQYPVLIFQYSGPGSQQVANTWGGGSNFLWHQMLVQQGYIVAVQDTRGTGHRGVDFQKVTYKQLGKLEVEDHIEGAKHLASLPYVNPDRIGIWGWSYGGYVSSLAMFLGSEHFKAGIAVAPVTTWRYYDTIYTERYLQRPQDNPSGYDDNSPITHAAKLEDSFLLVHGTGDDNVHFQNSIALQDELILHGKQFQSFYYPNRAHGISDYNARVHLFNMMTDFILKNL